MTLRQIGLALIATGALVAAGCGDDNKGSGGSGGTAGAGGSGGAGGAGGSGGSGGSGGTGGTGGSDGGMTSCDSVQTLTIASGMNSVSVTGDTTGAPSNLEPMTAGCRFGSDGGTAGEIVYRLVVPGSGNLLLTATTVDDATMADTIVYVQTMCGAGSELGCNDDDANIVGPSTATAPVTGGQTVFIVVDTYEAMYAGPFKLTVSVRPIRAMGENCDPTQTADICATGLICTPPGGATHTCTAGSPPTLTSVEGFFKDGSTTEAVFYMTGGDVDGDITSLTVTWKDGAGGMLAERTFNFSPPPVFGAPPFTSFNAAGLLFSLEVSGGGDAGTVTAASVALHFTDSLMHDSATVSATPVNAKNLTQACNPAINAPDECAHDLVCGSGNTCGVASATTTACSGASVLTSGTAVMDTLPVTGASLFEGSCFLVSRGPDKVYRITVPALGTGEVGHDVVATTGDAASFDPSTMTDTYVYIRTSCGNPATELACNDDISGSDYRSNAQARDVAPGNYFIFVDSSYPGGAMYKLTARVRPVLAAGQPCDPMGQLNRCHGTTSCPIGGSNPVCP